MREWDIKRADNETEVEQLLDAGWEPFAVDFNFLGNVEGKPFIVTRYMWFKKKVKLD